MSEANMAVKKRVRRIRHKGRGSQVLIYLGKQFRFFIYQSDWKVLPMAAVIAGLVSMVIRRRFFVNMEGSLIGAFALTCVAIWNGCFNSIQSVCRERAIIKREHRSGLHISSYVVAHMIYQFLLCAAQTALTMYVLRITGVQIPKGQGFITSWMILDIGITMFLVSYASDMLSLFISSISHSTTGAMTLMPFVLIFQLVFSSGVIPLPEWTRPISKFTVSNYGIRAIAAQSGYNELPMETVWKTVSGMKDNEIGTTVSVGQILDALDASFFEKNRDIEVLKSYTVGEVADILNNADQYLHLREKTIVHTITIRDIAEIILNTDSLKSVRDIKIIPFLSDATIGSLLSSLIDDPDAAPLLDLELGKSFTLGEVLDALHADELVQNTADVQLNEAITIGDIVDLAKKNEALQKQRAHTFTLKTTVREILNFFGEEEAKTFIEQKTAAAAYNADYEKSKENIIGNWLVLLCYMFLYALIAMIALELIDKDKR